MTLSAALNTTRSHADKRARRLRVAAASIVTALIVALLPAVAGMQPAEAALSNKCDGNIANDQNGLRVTASHGNVFYIDSGQSQQVDAAYVSYKIDNKLANSSQTNLWAAVDTFTGGIVQLANPSDYAQPIGDIGVSGTDTAFFLLKATSSTTKAQSHVVRVYSGKPGTAGATELYSCSYSFAKVAETIKAAANKVTSVTTVSSTVIGTTMTITVLGNTGTVGAGNAIDGSMLWISPAARSTWPTGALRLESTSVDLYSNSGRNQHVGNWTNQLRIGLTSGVKRYYTAVYTFRVIGTAPASATIIPVAQIASGTQIKHTDISSLGSGTPVNQTTTTTNLAVTKTVSATASVDPQGQTTLDYSISLTNSGSAVTVDQVTDIPSVGQSFVEGSATFAGAAIPDASRLASNTAKLVFAGPLSVPAGSTRVLTYSMQSPQCAGDFAFTNDATATVGTTLIGSSPATMSRVSVASACGDEVLDEHATTNVPLPVEATTAPASTVTTSGAKLNGLVDPNGQNGKDIVFEYGTSPTLAGATSVVAGQTTAATSAYATSTTLTGLEGGTVYYFRLSADGAVGEIFSFVTLEAASIPTAVTTTATDVTNSGTATLNGTVDPNQVASYARVKFMYGLDVSETVGTCQTVGTTTTTGYTQSENDSGTLSDAEYQGAFPTEANIGVTGLTTNANYCFTVIAYYSTATPANWTTPTAVPASNWVAFKAVLKSAQTITFPAQPELAVGQTTESGATSSASLPLSFESNTPEVCSVDSDGTISALAAGTCSVTASQNGSDFFDAATPETASLMVAEGSQTITFPQPDDINLAGSGESLAQATASSGLAISYIAATPSVCSVDEATGVITAHLLGECEIIATQPGDAETEAAQPVSRTLLVKTTQTISFSTPPSTATGDSVLADAASSSALAVTFESLTPDICVVHSQTGMIEAHNVGTCEIEATQAGSSTYFPAQAVTVAFAITAGPPVVTTESLADGVVNELYSATIFAGGGNGTYGNWAITAGSLPQGLYLDADTGIISGTPSGAETATFSVTVDSGELASQPRELTILIAKKAQTLTVADASAVWGDAPFDAEGSSNAGLPITYVSSDPSIVSVVGSTLTVEGVGVATITASAEGNSEFAAATDAPFDVTVSAAELTVTAPSPSVTYGDTLGALTPSITGWVNGDDLATIIQPTCSSSYSSTSAAGSSPAVTCSGASADDYEFSYVDGAVSIAKAAQTITATPDELEQMNTGSTQGFTATSSSGLDVTVVASGACTWDAGTITAADEPGECTLTASIAESENFLAAEDVIAIVDVAATPKTHRTLDIEPDGVGPYPVGSTEGISSELSPSVGEIVWSVPVTTSVCSVDAATGIVTFIAAGVCDIQATVAEDDDYFETTATTQLISERVARTLVLVSSDLTLTVGQTATLTATPSAGAGTITYQSITGTRCSVATNIATALRAGTCTVKAQIAQDVAYLAAESNTVAITVAAVVTPPDDDDDDTETPPGDGGDNETPAPGGDPEAPGAPGTPGGEETGDGDGTDPEGDPEGGSDGETDGATDGETDGDADGGSGGETAGDPSVGTDSNPTDGSVTPSGTLPSPTTVDVPTGVNSPPHTADSEDTIDIGGGAKPASLGLDWTQAGSLGSTKFEGFAPGSGARVDVIGARTVAQFVSTPGAMGSAVTVSAAIDESAARNGTDFARVGSADHIAEPAGNAVVAGEASTDARDLFTASGFTAPLTVGQLDLENATDWVDVSVDVTTYRPGSVVYLAVTSTPVIVGAALVSDQGTATIQGFIPTDAFETGGHNLRVVGVRTIGEVVAASDGSIQLSDAALAEVHRFDDGSTATILVTGANESGGIHEVVRRILLGAEAPWWSVWMLGAVGLLALAFRTASKNWSRPRRFISAVPIALVTMLPVLLGWFASSYAVMAVGLALGIVLQITVWIFPRWTPARRYGVVRAAHA